MLNKEEEKFLKNFIAEKYPIDTHVLSLDMCFDYYSGICSSIKELYKNQKGFYLLSQSEKANIENYIKINKHNQKGIEMSNYYNLLLNVINILKKYLPILSNVNDFDEVKALKIKGLKFLLPNLKDKFLFKIFENIDLPNHIWKIEKIEIYEDRTDGSLRIGNYSKKEFDTSFSLNNYYIVSALIIISKEIVKNSNQREIVLTCEITDLNNVEIICNNEELVELVYNNAEQNNFDKIEYIY